MGVLTMAAAGNHAAAEVGHTMLRVCVRQEDAVVPVQEGVQHSGRRDEIRPETAFFKPARGIYIMHQPAEDEPNTIQWAHKV
jgi:hypothetical protein